MQYKPKGKPTDPRVYGFIVFIVLLHIAGFAQALWMINSDIPAIPLAGMCLLCMMLLSTGLVLQKAMEIDSAAEKLLSDDDMKILQRLYEERWLYPGDLNQDAVASLFRLGLVRPEGDEITLTDKGISLMSKASALMSDQGAG